VRSETEQNNDLFYNQWQVDNFLPKKQLKAGGEVLSVLYYNKSCFAQKQLWLLGPLVGFWLLQKQKQVQKPNQTGPSCGVNQAF
jgi:hypothetical protein